MLEEWYNTLKLDRDWILITLLIHRANPEIQQKEETTDERKTHTERNSEPNSTNTA